jgi:polyphosphate kinase
VAAATGLRPLVKQQDHLFEYSLKEALRIQGINLINYVDLSQEERAFLHSYFEDYIFPVLTPLAVDPSHPFPYISNLSLNLAVVVRDPDTDEEEEVMVKEDLPEVSHENVKYIHLDNLKEEIILTDPEVIIQEDIIPEDIIQSDIIQSDTIQEDIISEDIIPEELITDINIVKTEVTDYKKMSLTKLRSIIAEKGLSDNISKLKKNECLQILGSNLHN